MITTGWVTRLELGSQNMMVPMRASHGWLFCQGDTAIPAGVRSPFSAPAEQTLQKTHSQTPGADWLRALGELIKSETNGDSLQMGPANIISTLAGSGWQGP